MTDERPASAGWFRFGAMLVAMASERSVELKVGLLIVVSSAILIGFIFVLGNFSLRSGFQIQVDYDYIGSLQPGAPVKVSGIKVGKIDAVDFLGGKPDPKVGGQRVQVRVTAWIEDRVRDSIRSDAEFFINTAGVLGEQYLEIVPGRDWDKPAIAANAVIHGAPAVHDPPRTDLVVSRLYEVLDGVSSVLHDDRDAIKHVLANSASAIAELNQLLVDRRQQIGDLIASAGDLAKQATVTLGKVNVGLGNGAPIASLLADADATLKTAQGTMQSLTPPAQSLMVDATRVTGLLTEQRIDKAIDVADKAATTAGKAGGLIDNVNGMVSDLRAGKGTAGALLSRDEIYSDLRELIRDLKRNPWKFFWKE
jgi:phospholipid/cholesterol/gamma-HCH transport system substrate-binding protein